MFSFVYNSENIFIWWKMEFYIPLGCRLLNGNSIFHFIKAVGRSIIGGGGAHVHIFVLCIISHYFWNRFFLRSVNMNIWKWPPAPNYRSSYGPASWKYFWIPISIRNFLFKVRQVINLTNGSCLKTRTL